MADTFEEVPTTYREAEIARTTGQVGVVDNLKLGHKQTALFAAGRKAEDEVPGVHIRNLKDGVTAAGVLVDNVDYSDLSGVQGQLKKAALVKATEIDRGVATVQALLNRTGEGDDPNYNKMDHIDSLLTDIPRRYHNDIMANNSLEAASRARGRVLEDLADQEVIAMQDFGGVTRFSTALVDADLPLVFATGGAFGASKLSAGTIKAAAAVRMGARGQQVAAAGVVGASGGAQSGLAIGLANLQWREGSGVSDVVNYTVMGTLGGAALMGAGKYGSTGISKSLKKLADDYADRVVSGDPTLNADPYIPDGAPAPDTVYTVGVKEAEIVFHGTDADFSDFDPALGSTPGAWFTPDEAQASGFGSIIKAVTLDIKSPGKLTDLAAARRAVVAAGTDATDAKFNRLVMEDLEAKGFDGIVDENAGGAGGSRVRVAFKASQITDATDKFAKGKTIKFTGVGSEGIDLPDGLTPIDFSGSVENLSDAHKDLVNRAHQSNYEADFYSQRDKDTSNIIQKMSNSKWATATGTGAQGKWYKSQSPLLNHVGQTFFENGSGFLRGKNTSGILDAKYTARIQTQLDGARTAAYDYAKSTGDTIAFGQGISHKGIAKFNREVMLERNRRAFGRGRSSDDNIRLAADSYDNAATEALRIGKGRDGETSIDGFQNLPDNPHYTPTVWGRKVGAIIRNHADQKAAKQAIIKGIAKSYREAGMNVGRDADAIANAVVSRSMNSDAGIDVSLVGLLQGDGRDVLREALAQTNMKASEIDGLMKRLVGSLEERSKEGFAKSKNELDLETTFDMPDGSTMQVVDLVSNDLGMDWHRYTRKAAGAAALARNGITNGADRSELITAVLTEQRRVGEDSFTRGELEAMFSAFDGGALKGHHWGMGDDATQEQGAVVATAKRAVNLAYLGKLGMTQLGETGGTIVQHGLANWAGRGVLPAFDKELRNANRKLLKEAAFLTGNIGKDEHYLAPHMNLDEMSTIDGATLSGKLQQGMADASFIQGYVSFFNTVRSWQQKTAALGVMDSVMREVRRDMAGGLSDKNLARLWGDFGLDAADVTRMSDMIEAGKVKFKTVNGVTFVDELGLDEWPADLAESFSSAIVRNTNATVQRAMAGEQDAWMSTQMGGLFTHLKTFPMQATQKQFARHFRHNDPKAYAAVGYTFATAYAASMVRGALDGKDMSTEEHAKRAFSYSNMTGFIPMAWDPLMTVLGMEDNRFSQFAPHSDITPPALGFANDALRLPGALGKAALGKADGSDRSSIRTLPFSNTILYGEMINGIATRNRE